MSLVGTRPPTVDEWEQYELHHRSRMSTKPGITGMWQVSGRSDITDFEEVVRLDTEYIEKDYKPMNVYGQTKLEGELAVSRTLEKYFIVRIAWVFGLNGKNFIKTMLNVGKTHDTVRVVNDQIGTPTYTYDLARLLVDMNETEKYG